MSITVNVIKEFSLMDFERLKYFGLLKSNQQKIANSIRYSDRHQWSRIPSGEIMHKAIITFVGQTGVGKSSTINSLLGNDFMEISAFESCTKEMNCVNFKIGYSNEYLSFCDMPGIGENVNADRQYLQWYNEMFWGADCVVYMLSADKRDFALDIEEFKKLYAMNPYKIIIGLNCIDKIEPLNRSYSGNFSLTQEQEMNLDRKIQDIASIFNVYRGNIVPFSAYEKYRLADLQQRISEVVLSQL